MSRDAAFVIVNYAGCTLNQKGLFTFTGDAQRFSTRAQAAARISRMSKPRRLSQRPTVLDTSDDRNLND